MSEFRSKEFGGLTPTELDEIAASGKPLASIGYGYDCRGSEETSSPDYGVRWVGTKGMGNYGTAVLVGLTPRGKALCRSGRVARLLVDGCPAELAGVAASMPYGMEMDVWSLAASLLGLARHGLDISTDWSGHRNFRRATGLESSCSFPRVCAARAIAARLI